MIFEIHSQEGFAPKSLNDMMGNQLIYKYQSRNKLYPLYSKRLTNV